MAPLAVALACAPACSPLLCSHGCERPGCMVERQRLLRMAMSYRLSPHIGVISASACV